MSESVEIERGDMNKKKVLIYVTAHPLYKPLKLNNSFRANCSGKMPLSLLAATI